MKNYILSICILLTCILSVNAQNNCTTYNQSYDVQNYFPHQIGEAWFHNQYAGWAILNNYTAGYLIYGQNILDADDTFSSGLRTVNFGLLIASTNGNGNDIMFTIDILDWTVINKRWMD